MFSPRRRCARHRRRAPPDVWRRPQLSPRERSLSTVAALTAGGNADQLSSRPQYAEDDGATGEQLIQAITRLAFPAGGPRVVSAMAVAEQVFGRDRPDRPGAPTGGV